MSLNQARLLRDTKQTLVSFLDSNINAQPYAAHWAKVGGTVCVVTRNRLRLVKDAAGEMRMTQPHVNIRKTGGEINRTESRSDEFAYAGEYQAFDFEIEAITSDACGGDQTCDDLSSALLQLFARKGAGYDALKALGIAVHEFDNGVEQNDENLYINLHRLRVEVFLQTGNIVKTNPVVMATVEMHGTSDPLVRLGATLTVPAPLRIRTLTGINGKALTVTATCRTIDGNEASAIGVIAINRRADTIINMEMSPPGTKVVKALAVAVSGGMAGEKFVIESIPSQL